MEIDVIQKVYRRYARRYDFYFGALFQPGRKAVIERMHCRPGDRILEVGVGTGLSLPLYPRGVRVTVCTDNTLFSAVDAPGEYRRAAAIPGVGAAALGALATFGHAAAFPRRTQGPRA